MISVNANTLPMLPVCQEVLQQKYLKQGETTQDEVFQRVARQLASVEPSHRQKEIEQLFYENMKDGAIGAGRIMSSGGTTIKATLMNCFVQPVGDCISGYDEDGFPGIYTALELAAETMRMGGGVGYNFSNIRPLNAWIRSTQSMASGPCSYMNVFDASCTTVESLGSRRGAQMGVLDIFHPDIEQFVKAKHTVGRWNNFNVSVGVTDKFMEAVMADGDWQLYHKAQPHYNVIPKDEQVILENGCYLWKTIKAKSLWDAIMQNTYDFAEPGILFLDTINRENPLGYCEIIKATNPCGEQPLPPYGCCDLGPIILPFLVSNPFGFGGDPVFDFEKLKQMVAVSVRYLDNVLDATHWPLEQQKQESASKRRIGVGYTGLGNALAMMKLKYHSPEGRAFASKIAEVMRDAAYFASCILAEEKGAFPLFNAEQYLTSPFIQRLPSYIKDRIHTSGIRNSHLLSIAPTGTVSMAFANNVSNGIEPPFSYSYTRKKREQDGSHTFHEVSDFAFRLYNKLSGDAPLPDYFVTALEMSVDDHMKMMEVTQPFIDSAISKTVNIPGDYPFEDFQGLYMQAWQAGLKGLATYRPNATLGSVLSVTPAPETAPKAEPAPEVEASKTRAELETQVIHKRPKGALPATIEKIEYSGSMGRGRFYLSVGYLPLTSGEITVFRPVEFFLKNLDNDSTDQWSESAMRMLSLAARGGFLAQALKDMQKVTWDRGPVRLGETQHVDGYKVPMFHKSQAAAVAYAIQSSIKTYTENQNSILVVPLAESEAVVEVAPTFNGKLCPECGAHAVVKRDGCEKCENCGMMGSCG